VSNTFSIVSFCVLSAMLFYSMTIKISQLYFSATPKLYAELSEGHKLPPLSQWMDDFPQLAVDAVKGASLSIGA